MKLTLGAFIAQLRKEKGLTQKQLSEILGVSDKTVSHWEREESAPDISILPLLAEALGVTTDELLTGERKEPIGSVSQFIPTPNPDKTPNNYRLFKIFNIISAALSLFSLILGVGIKFLFSHLIYAGSANGFAFFVTLGGVFISYVLTVIFNIIFTTKLNPESDSRDKYRFSANRISSLNFYSGLLCISVTLSFAGRHGFIYIIIALALCLILEAILKSTSFLSTEKAFETKTKENIYLLRRSCALLCIVLIVLGGSVHFFFSEIWIAGSVETVIDSVEDFKAYMETPKETPEDAWQIDGVKMTTLPPTASSNNELTSQSPVVSITPSQNSNYVYNETVYDDTGREIVTFSFKNKEVYRYSYNSDEGRFHITTYNSMRRAEKINNFCNHALGMLMPFYYIAVVIVSLIRYKKKSVEI